MLFSNVQRNIFNKQVPHPVAYACRNVFQLSSNGSYHTILQ